MGYAKQGYGGELLPQKGCGKTHLGQKLGE